MENEEARTDNSLPHQDHLVSFIFTITTLQSQTIHHIRTRVKLVRDLDKRRYDWYRQWTFAYP